MEFWKDITGFEGFYKVSNTGKVSSCDRQKEQHGRKRTGRELRLEQNKAGQESVCLMAYGEKKKVLVSRIVASEFIRPLKKGESVFHLDLVKFNNNVDNLIILKSGKDVMELVNKSLCDGFEKISRDQITVEKVKEYLFYLDGDLYFKKRTALTVKVGEKSGFAQEGHWKIHLCGETYMRNWLIYFLHTGERNDYVLPKNGDFMDGRVENLYSVSASEYAKITDRVQNIHT